MHSLDSGIGSGTLSMIDRRAADVYDDAFASRANLVHQKVLRADQWKQEDWRANDWRTNDSQTNLPQTDKRRTNASRADFQLTIIR
jgi:hypothetical protein